MDPNIDIEKICLEKEIDQKALAVFLFPGNQYAMMALKRVMKGEALLNSDQVLRLSEYTGIPVDKLFGGNWKAYSSKDRPEIIVYERDDCKAELNITIWSTRITKGGDDLGTLIHGPNLVLSEYLKEIEDFIESKKS